MAFETLVEVLRGGRLESVHSGALAVVETNGRRVAWCGDPSTETFLRSSAKPLQALPLVESGAADALGLTDRQLAVICGSHTGTREHLEVVESIQRVAGLAESDLLCGAHTPYDAEEAQRMREAGEAPRTNHNNCSGKHSGMLALAKHLHAPLENYLERTHPVQRRIVTTLAEMAGVGESEIGVGVDGCSAPNFSLPLDAAATAFARLADPSGLPVGRANACGRIFRAMVSEPRMVAGPGAFDTRLIEAGGGRWIAKAGAEGYYAMAIAPEAGKPALGIAAKIADGDAARRATSPVVLALLQALGYTFEADASFADHFGPRHVRNWRGLEVGETRVTLPLHRA